jgi:hypothetical protein
MRTFRPVLFLAIVLMLVGLACSALAGGGDTPPEQPVVTEEPIQVQLPTEAPATEEPTEEVVVTEAPVAMDFFTEEFDTPLSSDWSVFTITDPSVSDLDKVSVEAEDGNLVWDFDSEYVYYYLFYGGYEYDDVQLDVRSDNLGRNNNNISLICRYDDEVGWYEFNIANNGLYDILFAKVLDNGKIQWNRVANGGSNAIKQGKEVNEYSITCEGEELTLNINGEEVISIKERNYGINSGQVGVSVSSFNVLPVLIEMDWIKISQP